MCCFDVKAVAFRPIFDVPNIFVRLIQFICFVYLLCNVVSLEDVKRYIKRFEKLQTGFGFGMNYTFFKKLFTLKTNTSSTTTSSYTQTKTALNKNKQSSTTISNQHHPSSSSFASEHLFQSWSHHHSTLDALELFSAMLLISVGTFENKCLSVFQLYDFDENQTLTQDELIMCVKTSVHALCKLTNTSCPSSKILESVAIKAYTALNCGKR